VTITVQQNSIIVVIFVFFLRELSLPMEEMQSAISSLLLRAAADVEVQDAIFEARGFLVAWGGVLALAFREWPPIVRSLKDLMNAVAALHAGAADQALLRLSVENPGSRWPKITIGALRPGHILTLQDLERLRALCLQSSKHIRRLALQVQCQF